MDLPKAVQGVAETVRWPEFTWLDFCNEGINIFNFSQDDTTFERVLEIYMSVGFYL